MWRGRGRQVRTRAKMMDNKIGWVPTPPPSTPRSAISQGDLPAAHELSWPTHTGLPQLTSLPSPGPMEGWRRLSGGLCRAGSKQRHVEWNCLQHAGYLNRTRTPDTAPGTQTSLKPLLQRPQGRLQGEDPPTHNNHGDNRCGGTIF